LDPIVEATRFLHFLQLHSASALETQLQAIEVFIRKERWLLVWKAIKLAKQIQADSADLHYGLMRFIHVVQSRWNDLHPMVQRLLEDEWKVEAGDEQQSIHDANVVALNAKHLEDHRNAIDHRFAGHNTTHRRNNCNC
jgi:N-alpha-acetyltransferase 15/16, NatA auxiliary subunit